MSFTANVATSRFALFASCCLTFVVMTASLAQQPPDGAVPITSEPDHKIRFDNGAIRVYEVILPKGKTTLVHEHTADSFTVFVGVADATNEPHGGKPVQFQRPSGFVGFTSTAKGAYSHRVAASGQAFHVVVLELLSPTPSGSATANERPSVSKVAAESARGRAYRITLAPGESTGRFTRARGSVLVAVSAGRISESSSDRPGRFWDFEPGHFRWFDVADKLEMKNESSSPIDLVEIEVF